MTKKMETPNGVNEFMLFRPRSESRDDHEWMVRLPDGFCVTCGFGYPGECRSRKLSQIILNDQVSDLNAELGEWIKREADEDGKIRMEYEIKVKEDETVKT
jgi:hypothetical protein